MKKWTGLFEEKVSRSYRRQVLDAARNELKEAQTPRSSLRQSLQWIATAAGVAALTWLGTRAVKPPENESVDQAAFMNTDPELLENLDWLEDFDVLTNEELDEWT